MCVRERERADIPSPSVEGSKIIFIVSVTHNGHQTGQDSHDDCWDHNKD